MAFFSRKPKITPPPQTVVVSNASTNVPATPAGPDASMAGNTPRETRIFDLGSDLLKRARGHKSGVLSAQFYSDALMNWSMKDQNFKVQLFRFVDAFPMLKNAEAIHDHLDDYLTQPGVTVPGPIAAALKAGALLKSVSAGMISKQITGMASKFIAGTDAASALPGLKELWNDGIAFSVDLLGETCVSEEESEYYAKKYLDLIQNLPATVASWKSQPALETDHLGTVPRTNVSIKISALSSRVDPIDTEGSIQGLMTRLLPILETARDRGVFINFDMEHFAFKDLTIELFQRCVEKIDFQSGLAMQAYLRSGPDDAKRMAEWAKRKNKLVTVRLVKGAYWDAETIKSEMHGWPVPVWAKKWETDACFERMAEIFLDACPVLGSSPLRGESAPSPSRPSGIKLALGSHNVRSIAAALAGLESRNLPRNAIELQMLHGMADQLKYAAAEMGLRVREYVPVGDMIPGMAYLVRRLLENTSNESWLKAGFMENADAGALLRVPGPTDVRPSGVVVPGTASGSGVGVSSPLPHGRVSDGVRHQLSAAVAGVGNGEPFFNESMRDFADARQRSDFSQAVARATVPKVANERTPADGSAMVERAAKAFPMWRDVDARVRANALVLAASRMRELRDGLAGVMIKESGKTWREADADVCEAIDFCEFYAREAVGLFERKRLGRFIGELDEAWYQPKGVAVVISPWNFPLAICCGMTAAAMVTGNTVIVKPAEQTPGIASIMVDILRESIQKAIAAAGSAGGGKGGIKVKADDVLHFCPGPGETVGASLVRDPRIALVAFTGSRDVGLDILQAAAPISPFSNSGSSSTNAPRSSPTHIKRVIAELGGKNAVIVDVSADFDEAVLGVRQSAFGFQGQKCSACSRCIVVDPDGAQGPAITTFSRRLVEATKALIIGDPVNPGTDVGPVIDHDAKQKIQGFIQRATAGGLKAHGLQVPEGLEAATGKPYVAPTIFLNVPPDHELAREEVFGPVLAVIHAHTFTEALEIANSPSYKLTGGVFTRKPSHLEQAKRDFRVGNLYINRGITGALVGRQPFGGFAMSGVGSKAGGHDYLLQFVEPRASCENTMRRGFAPEL
jgi:RHH-type transcriptional regulator, proline utilization regulon repressor / proline dehydrogenase / delta 1-pyrroline-5-carboxylate dehydrogenase